MTILLTGCQTNEIVLEEPSSENGKRTITFSMNIPDFQVKSRAESETPIQTIQLMIFGNDRCYIETVTASSINGIKEGNGVSDNSDGTFSATIDANAKIIHFIANYNGNLTAEKGDTEDNVIPALTASTDSIVYWARNEIRSEDTSIHVNFLRHVAKVTVEVSDEVIDGYAAKDYFQVTGFAICQYVAQGTIAPKNYEWGYKTNDDGSITETPTEVGIGTTTPATFPTTNPNELYLAECLNDGNQDEQVYVIIAGQLKSKNNDDEWNVNGEWEKEIKYYKVLLTDPNDNPFKIIRNVNYKVVIKQMQDVGATDFEEAKGSNPINNLYAYVMAESPSISDMDGYTLTVTPIVHLLTTEGSFESLVSVSKPSTSTDDRKLQCSDPTGDNILRDISLTTTGKLTGNVTAVKELKKSQIRVTYGKLSRTVTVIASPQFTIEAKAYSDANCTTMKSSYQAADEDVYFKFNLDTDYPSATDYPDLYPIKCYIKADNLYPVDNKDMLIDYEYQAGQYWYTYLAKSTGEHKIHFKTKLSGVNEKIEVESEYFGHSEVSLTYQELKSFTNISWTNLDRYGSRNDGTFSFRTENANDKVTVTIREGDTVIYSDTHTGSTTYTISTIELTTWGNQVTVTLEGVGYIPKTTSIERNKLVIPAGKLNSNTKDNDFKISTDNGKNNNGININIPSSTDQVVTISGLTEYTPLYFKYSDTFMFWSSYYISNLSYNGPTITEPTTDDNKITLTFVEQK